MIAEKYCPNCKTTHTFAEKYFFEYGTTDFSKPPQGIGWECPYTKQLFTSTQLDYAFVNLRKDHEYAEKGISLQLKAGTIPTSASYLSLPTDSEGRKGYPILSGCIKYFAAALAGVARISKAGNDKHNPGKPLHHNRSKSGDHGDCIIRHLIDVEDMLTANLRNPNNPPFNAQQILDEASSLSWRALAYSQELHEKLGKAPMAPGAKLDTL
jgi:glutaredoxin